jgi:electron transfer flavoprotein beta subunit
LLTVELELAKPRRASLPRLLDSLRAKLTVWDAKAIGAAPGLLGLKGSPTWVKRIFSPPLRQGGPCFNAGEDVAGAVSGCLDELFSDNQFASRVIGNRESLERHG